MFRHTQFPEARKINGLGYQLGTGRGAKQGEHLNNKLSAIRVGRYERPRQRCSERGWEALGLWELRQGVPNSHLGVRKGLSRRGVFARLSSKDSKEKRSRKKEQQV